MPNLLINAGPGCGKTSTIVDAYIYYRTTKPELWLQKFRHTEEQAAVYNWCRESLPRKENGEPLPAIYLAYNNTTVDDLKNRIHSESEVKTHHGWGYKVLQRALGYIPLNKKDYTDRLIETVTGRTLSSDKNKFSWITSFRFVEKLQEELLEVTEENMYLMQAKYSDLAPYKIHPDICQQSSEIIRAMKSANHRQLGISHMLQVWLALFMLPKPLYEIGFVDECQDLSPARLALSFKLCRNLVFVGDTNQAINAWTGADPESISKIAEHCSTQLPLRLSFRLPPNMAQTANTICPSAQIRTLPDRTPGIVSKVRAENIVEWSRSMVENSPMIICRYKAPLMKLALQLVKNQIPCRTLGDSLAKSLISTVQNRRAKNIDDLLLKLASYEELCLRAGSPMAKQATADRFDCIRHILKDCNTIEEFEPLVQSLLKPPKGIKHITLCTIHKAKGLEADIIGILNPPVQSERAKTDIEIKQEINIDFVAHTRTKRDLYYIYAE